MRSGANPSLRCGKREGDAKKGDEKGCEEKREESYFCLSRDRTTAATVQLLQPYCSGDYTVAVTVQLPRPDYFRTASFHSRTFTV